MTRWPWIVCGIILITGCASLTQAAHDTQVGRTTPLAVGELSPAQQAHSLLDPFTSLPYAGVAVPFLIPVVGVFYAWRRGRRLRLHVPPAPPNPVLGTLANLVHGAFEVGPDNSGLKRGWKVLLSLGISAFSLPSVQHWVLAHPQDAVLFASVASVMAGMEKELSKLIPPPPTTPLPGSPA